MKTVFAFFLYFVFHVGVVTLVLESLMRGLFFLGIFSREN